MNSRNFLMHSASLQKFTYENDGYMLYCCLSPKELYMMLVPLKQQQNKNDYYFTRTFNFRNYMYSDNNQLIHAFQNFQSMFKYMQILSQLKCIKLQSGYFQFHVQGQETLYKIILTKVVTTNSQAGLLYMLKTEQTKKQLSPEHQNTNIKNLISQPSLYQFKRQKRQGFQAEKQIQRQGNHVSKKVKKNQENNQTLVFTQTLINNQCSIENNQTHNNDTTLNNKNQISLKRYNQIFRKMEDQREQLQKIIKNFEYITEKCKQSIPQFVKQNKDEQIDKESFLLIEKLMKQQQQEISSVQQNQEQQNSTSRVEIVSRVQQLVQRQVKQCMICLQELLPQQNKTYLICFHDFHSTCIQDWLKIKNKCPICQVRQNSQEQDDDQSSDNQSNQDQNQDQVEQQSTQERQRRQSRQRGQRRQRQQRQRLQQRIRRQRSQRRQRIQERLRTQSRQRRREVNNSNQVSRNRNDNRNYRNSSQQRPIQQNINRHRVVGIESTQHSSSSSSRVVTNRNIRTVDTNRSRTNSTNQRTRRQ